MVNVNPFATTLNCCTQQAWRRGACEELPSHVFVATFVWGTTYRLQVFEVEQREKKFDKATPGPHMEVGPAIGFRLACRMLAGQTNKSAEAIMENTLLFLMAFPNGTKKSTRVLTLLEMDTFKPLLLKNRSGNRSSVSSEFTII